MKRRGSKIKTLAAAAGVMGALLNPAAVFAANPYGIEYTGGTPLSESNVVVNPGLINSLNRVINEDVILSNSDLWQEGAYVKVAANGECEGPYSYFKVHKNDVINAANGLSWITKNNKYEQDVSIKKIVFEDLNDSFSDTDYVVVYLSKAGTINAGFERMYTGSTCAETSEMTGVKGLSRNARLFIEMDMKLYKLGQDSEKTLVKSNDLYFRMTDVDSSQSYKIQNANNMLSKNNMVVSSISSVQPDNSDLRNMFVGNGPEGSYIYSQYGDDGNFNLQGGDGNIFVKIAPETQQEGLDVVFGFASGAGSNAFYYTKMYDVNYTSDEYGEIAGITEEEVMAGDTTAGSSTKSDEGYVLDYWIADKDVVVEGKGIKAGKPITQDQLDKIVVNSDLTLTAIHKAEKSDVAVPDTGFSTGEMNAVQITASVVGVLIGALAIALAPRFIHKRVSFKK